MHENEETIRELYAAAEPQDHGYDAVSVLMPQIGAGSGETLNQEKSK